MAVPLIDEIPIREANHAWKESAPLRELVLLAEEVFAELRVAGQTLFRRSVDVIAEEADDASPRQRRDAAALALRTGCTAKLLRFRALAAVATTDELGNVVDPDLATDVAAFLASWLPDGQASAIASEGEKLDVQAAAIREGLARFTKVPGTAKLAEDLGRLIDVHTAARDVVGTEEDELRVAREALTAARQDAAAARTTARLYLQFHLSRRGAPKVVEFDRVFPVRVRSTDVQAKVALDEAGAEEVAED